MQEAVRSVGRLQSLLWQEEQTQRKEKILQHWAVLPNVSPHWLYRIKNLSFISFYVTAACEGIKKNKTAGFPPVLGGGQESGRSAAAAVTAACGRGRCYAKGGFL